MKINMTALVKELSKRGLALFDTDIPEEVRRKIVSNKDITLKEAHTIAKCLDCTVSAITLETKELPEEA